jgi:hypothetical protein
MVTAMVPHALKGLSTSLGQKKNFHHFYRRNYSTRLLPSSHPHCLSGVPYHPHLKQVCACGNNIGPELAPSLPRIFKQSSAHDVAQQPEWVHRFPDNRQPTIVPQTWGSSQIARDTGTVVRWVPASERPLLYVTVYCFAALYR